MSQLVELEIVHAAAIVWMSNPPSNVMSRAMLQDLGDHIDALQEREDIDRIILTGGSYAFSTGYLLADLRDTSTSVAIFDLCRKIETSRIPIIAAVSGTCVDGGFELALACDWRIVAPQAHLGFPYAQFDICPPSGALQRLVSLVGVQESFDIFLAGAAIKVEDLAHSGCIHLIDDAPLQLAREMDLSGTRGVPPLDPQNFTAQIAEFRAQITPEDSHVLMEIARLIEGAHLLPYEQALNVEHEYAKAQLSSDRFAAVCYRARAEQYATAAHRQHALTHVTCIGHSSLREYIASQAAAAGIGVHISTPDAPIPEGTDLVLVFDAFDGPERFAQAVEKMRRLGDVPRFFVAASLEDDWPALPPELRADVGGVEFALQEGRDVRAALLCAAQLRDRQALQGFLTQMGIIPIAVPDQAIGVTGRIMSGFALSYEALLRRGHSLEEIDSALEALGFAYPFGHVARALGPEGVVELCQRFDVGPTPFYHMLIAQSVTFDPEDASDLPQLADHSASYLRHVRKIQRHAVAGPLMVLLEMCQACEIERLSDIDIWLNEALGLDRGAGGLIALAQRLGVVNMRAVLSENAQWSPAAWHVPKGLEHLLIDAGRLDDAALRKGGLALAEVNSHNHTA
jgi:3-hydroxyacyl-CoA dehydrogenase